MRSFCFVTTPRLVCHPGAIACIGEELTRLNVKRPLVVSDAGIKASGLLDTLLKVLETHTISATLFTDVVADPPEAVVHQAVKVGQAAQVDGVVALGGGSTLDTAKVVARLLCPQPDGLEQPLSAMYGVDNLRGQRLPLVLIPTTAGTGSETTPVAILTTGETTKAGIVSPTLLPDVAILDAELTLNLPPAITAATGIDAMVHALEAMTSKIKKNIYSSMLAREALHLLSQHIEEACTVPHSLVARNHMLIGAFMAGQAFANAPVAAVHALAYPLGGHFHLSHGLSNAMVLPEVIRFNGQHAPEYQQILSIVAPQHFISEGNSAEALAAYFSQLQQRLGLPMRLREVGVTRDALPLLAHDAMQQQRLLVNNPRVLNEADALAIYEACW